MHNWYCDICHEPLWQQLGHWWHVTDKGCKGPDRPLSREELRRLNA